MEKTPVQLEFLRELTDFANEVNVLTFSDSHVLIEARLRKDVFVYVRFGLNSETRVYSNERSFSLGCVNTLNYIKRL